MTYMDPKASVLPTTPQRLTMIPALLYNHVNQVVKLNLPELHYICNNFAIPVLYLSNTNISQEFLIRYTAPLNTGFYQFWRVSCFVLYSMFNNFEKN